VSRSSDYLRSLTSLTLTRVNFYKLGKIAAYIEGLEGALTEFVEKTDDWSETREMIARGAAALKEPEI
jgi:hypothetical protein